LAKAPSDYLRALRRRVWLVLAMGVALSVAGAVWAVRLPAIYRATAEIIIEPPQYDEVLSTLVSRDVGRRDPATAAAYVPNRAALLRSKVLAEKVVNDLPPAQPAAKGSDPAQELLNALSTRQIPLTNYFIISLEGTDPARTTNLLNNLLRTFSDQAFDDILRRADESRTQAQISLNGLEAQLKDKDTLIQTTLKASTTIGPGGRNILESEYVTLGAILMQKRMRLEDLKQQALSAQYDTRLRGRPELPQRDGQLAELQKERRKWDKTLRRVKGLARSPSDPSVRHAAGQLDAILDDIERLKTMPIPTDLAAEASEMMVARSGEEIHRDEEAAKVLLARLQESTPEHTRFLNLLEDRKQVSDRIGDMKVKLSEFEILFKAQKSPVRIVAPAIEPTVPVRPNRVLSVLLCIGLAFGLGIALVCLLEHVDHSVKVPEHLTTGLTLPLLGVVPQIRRTSRLYRGGHLWTPNTPESIEADTYRNLRASLLGFADKRGPLVSLLVTSAKAGEGKSTTALNLAATCARAGERTLLMDVDLRRPSLADVFGVDDHDLGLVDVLRGDLPWQRTVVRTDIPNLDFLPTGETRDVPIEVLGTLELRQLLIALSNHYDRVILDGPAVLGLADCRMLGRVVNAALLVVRPGAHELRPLLRAKAMLEQSHVVMAGVVFNGIVEDLKNWSSYGPYTPYGYHDGGSGRGSRDTAANLPARSDEHAVPHVAGTVSG
jgi:capsular exopolysaccharide synthesis family protein